MFTTFLRRELAGRRRQTVIIALGTALAIALVILVNSVSTGVKDAQASVLESVYGVGTDLTVTGAPAEPGQGGGPGRFEFGADQGETTDDGSTEVSTSRLTTGFSTSTFEDSAIDTVLGVDGVSAASGYLELTNTTFDGELPDFSQMQQGEQQTGGGGTTGGGQQPPTGGFDGAGGSAFDVNSFSVIGLDPGAATAGPLSAVSLTDGRAFESGDTGTDVAILDASYATTAELAVGDTIDVGGSDFEVVGIVESTSADAETAANVYIPLDVAQTLSGNEGLISTLSVSAGSAADIDAIQAGIEAALPDLTVSTQADLAANVSGSLGSASTLISSLGLWLSIAVLVAAFLIAILLTVQSVSRRTREFGTLKAIGWRNRRIVGQVAGESLVQGLIGGVVGLALGLIGILVVNLVSPTLGGTTGGSGFDFGGQGGGGQTGGQGGDAGQMMGGGGGPFGQAGGGSTTTEVVLHAPITPSVILLAIGIAVLGGLLAGAIGGWRASRLRPAEALRSLA
ncbi:ABC transporter permease [Agromyces seonyuensis]|uniref:FtsX-like permease family protein n=1 Tax=Agromyces seonyuensis TaxID=2662446 RepID=A0A6I4NU29_9MICO|nr:FtsX-like permease family protein [Agromyces seonyuensis]MWB97601.1 FtsX-like permease family protein [Agromyces seonyuensis]